MSFLSFNQSLFWITYSPVSDPTKDYYGKEYSVTPLPTVHPGRECGAWPLRATRARGAGGAGELVPSDGPVCLPKPAALQ